jgi:hypothetical protein
MKLGLASCNKPKPQGAIIDNPGHEYLKPEAVKSWAVDPAFRPSRAGKPLVIGDGPCDKTRQLNTIACKLHGSDSMNHKKSHRTTLD